MKERAMACTGSLARRPPPSRPGAAVVKINEAITTITQQGLDAQNSQVIALSSWLTHARDPGLTGSPTTQQPGEWAAATISSRAGRFTN